MSISTEAPPRAAAPGHESWARLRGMNSRRDVMEYAATAIAPSVLRPTHIFSLLALVASFDEGMMMSGNVIELEAYRRPASRRTPEPVPEGLRQATRLRLLAADLRGFRPEALRVDIADPVVFGGRFGEALAWHAAVAKGARESSGECPPDRLVPLDYGAELGADGRIRQRFTLAAVSADQTRAAQSLIETAPLLARKLMLASVGTAEHVMPLPLHLNLALVSSDGKVAVVEERGVVKGGLDHELLAGAAYGQGPFDVFAAARDAAQALFVTPLPRDLVSGGSLAFTAVVVDERVPAWHLIGCIDLRGGGEAFAHHHVSPPSTTSFTWLPFAESAVYAALLARGDRLASTAYFGLQLALSRAHRANP